jgi:6-pyruvoyltetrahydropterin/6-carboxytetrahydropterin synthase
MAFSAGHRLMGHEGRCVALHGHNYRVEVTVTAPALDAVGRVADFDVVHEVVWTWIARHWDHNMLLARDDAEVIAAVARWCGAEGPYLMDNPTAENMAMELHRACAPALRARGMTLERIVIWETDDCAATYP